MQYTFSSRIHATPEQVFAWFEKPNALYELIPPWQKVEIIKPPENLHEGTEVVLKFHKGPISIEWVAVHTDYQPGLSFTDQQVRGPFKKWRHTHKTEGLQSAQCLLVDEIDWELPGGEWVSSLFRPILHKKLDEVFTFRHRVVFDHFFKEELEKGNHRAVVSQDA